MDLQSKKIKKFLDDDERAKLPTIWHSKFEKFWMTMNGAKHSERNENCEKRRKYRNI